MTEFTIKLDQKEKEEIALIYPGNPKDMFNTVTESESEGDLATEASDKKSIQPRNKKGRFTKKVVEYNTGNLTLDKTILEINLRISKYFIKKYY